MLLYDFAPQPTVKPEVTEQYIAHAETLGLPAVEYAGHVAVVGGGPSLAGHLDELRAWKGPIWAINETWRWLNERGIKATFFTCDPKMQAWVRTELIDKALVAIHLCPEMFEALALSNVRTFRLAPDDIHCGFTTATAAPHLALKMGHHSVSFFGCDSSFVNGESHVYGGSLPGDQIAVEIGGQTFATKPEFLMQAQDIAELCREEPTLCRNRSDGLLTALIAEPAYRIVSGPKEIAA